MGLNVPVILLQCVTATSLVLSDNKSFNFERGRVNDSVSNSHIFRVTLALLASRIQGPIFAIVVKSRNTKETYPRDRYS